MPLQERNGTCADIFLMLTHLASRSAYSNALIVSARLYSTHCLVMRGALATPVRTLFDTHGN
jgi:hypothetical protein